MVCKKCGALLSDNAVFCDVCKTPVVSTTLKSSATDKSADMLLEQILAETKSNTNINKNREQTNDEWLNDEALREIQNISKEPEPVQSYEDDQMLPDGKPEWLEQIKQEEEEERYRQSFHFFDHPVLVTSIVAFIMAVASASFLLTTFNV